MELTKACENVKATHLDINVKKDIVFQARSDWDSWIKSKTDYKHGQPIRLLSCDTGSSTSGFAQNLANKLNVVVEAPTKLVWAYPNGKYFVAGRRKDNPNLPDMNNPGVFKKFYPGGKKK